MSTAIAEAAPASVLKNYTFDELNVGDCASLVRIVGRDDIDLFAAVSGDVNPAHLDATFAATDLFGHVVAHGMWTAALVSAVRHDLSRTGPAVSQAVTGSIAYVDAGYHVMS